MRRFHIGVALLVVASVVSLVGVSLVGGESPGGAVQVVKIQSTSPVDKNVWFEAAPGLWLPRPFPLPPIWRPKSSALFASWGRQRLHLVWYAGGMEAGDEISLKIFARLWNADKSAYKSVEVYARTIYDTYPSGDTTLYVPTKQFYFQAYGPSDTTISLSFYLSGS